MNNVLRVRRPGLFTTVQDLGRLAYQHLGVPASGALDSISLRLANALVGNADGLAGLEFCYSGPDLEVAGEPVRVALSCEALIIGRNEGALKPWHTARLHPGDVLSVGNLKGSMCGYLAVEGGFALAPVLGSLSTYTRGGFGGFEGRQLIAGDELPLVLSCANERKEVHLPAPPRKAAGPIRVTLGPDHDHFSTAAINTLLSSAYTVSQEADRIGLRLDGPLIEHCGSFEIASQGTANGTIQVPGNGRPIILLADRQTTGGYTKLATVISADLPRLGRLQPGSRITFEAVEPRQGVQIARTQAAAWRDTLAAIEPVKSSHPAHASDLLALNLVDGFVSALGNE
jgi:UPF0271 protein